MISSTLAAPTSATGRLRGRCRGTAPLPGRLAPWIQRWLQAAPLAELVARFGSPLNLLCTDPMRENIEELQQAALACDSTLDIYFARKSNKCLTFVDRALACGIGVDTASEHELRQSLRAGLSSEKLVCTAAVKSESLVDLCLAPPAGHAEAGAGDEARAEGRSAGIVIAVDNTDELQLVSARARQLGRRAAVAIRLGGFHHQGRKLRTRFGFDVDRDTDLVERLGELPVDVQGIHFHLDGYDAGQRVTAIRESVRWAQCLRRRGHAVSFVDMGGGIPMSYLEDQRSWQEFRRRLELALCGRGSPITYQNHGLGLSCRQGKVEGQLRCYPYYQAVVRAAWLSSILQAECGRTGRTIAGLLRERELHLRCEPGRSLLDGCGATVARVEYRKQNADGEWLIGLAMNRTQCRTSSEDFLVDPLLIPARGAGDDRGQPAMAGYLVGAYCAEGDLISWRKLHFPAGVQRGDLLIFPNTAGYLMHFLESRSHQLPLATNLVVAAAEGPGFEVAVDAIDTLEARSNVLV
ncbi:MAG: Y4yA family PLP-dependent enzyme [Planctomycetales bacterium]|nr:Y4yA family PLP-dependent enzyme [Planctomycetales bacterium]